MNKRQWTLAELNSMDRGTFTRVVGPVFELSPWIAEMAWVRRPFDTLTALHATLCDLVAQSGYTKQLALIQSHPDLVGDVATQGTLTNASSQEQASAGLNRLSVEESANFQELNRQYREQFGFPFVLCARLNKKEAILAAFPNRLKNSREAEIQIALTEIAKIARLRLEDLVRT